MLIFDCALLAVVLDYGAISAINGNWWELVLALFLAGTPSTRIVMLTMQTSRIRKGDRQSKLSDGSGT